MGEGREKSRTLCLATVGERHEDIPRPLPPPLVVANEAASAASFPVVERVQRVEATALLAEALHVVGQHHLAGFGVHLAHAVAAIVLLALREVHATDVHLADSEAGRDDATSADVWSGRNQIPELFPQVDSLLNAAERIGDGN